MWSGSAYKTPTINIQLRREIGKHFLLPASMRVSAARTKWTSSPRVSKYVQVARVEETFAASWLKRWNSWLQEHDNKRTHRHTPAPLWQPFLLVSLYFSPLGFRCAFTLPLAQVLAIVLRATASSARPPGTAGEFYWTRSGDFLFLLLRLSRFWNVVWLSKLVTLLEFHCFDFGTDVPTPSSALTWSETPNYRNAQWYFAMVVIILSK